MKTLKFLIISLLLLGGTTTLQAQTIEDASAKYTSGIESLKAGDFANAAAQLEEGMNIGFDLGDEGLDIVKEIQGLLPKVYFQAGVAAIKGNKFEEAIEELQSAYELADLYGDVTTARQASRAISSTYQAQGATAFNEKDYETALVSFKKGYEQDPTNVKLSLLTAKTYAELGELESALSIYNEVIAIGTNNSRYAPDAEEAQKDVNTYVLLAASEAAKTEDLAKVMELAALVPDNEQVALMSMQVANNLKDYNVIMANAEAAAELQSDEAAKSDVYYMLGVAYNNTKNYPAAKSALAKVTAGNNVSAAKTLSSQIN